MNVEKVVGELQRKYPRKRIVKNDKDNPTEIICEVESALDNPKQSKAIAVIDRTVSHYHKKTTEEYKVLRGILILTIEGRDYSIPEGQSHTIDPMLCYSAKGDSAWVECISTPG
jgi:mannose-6-phosphate isomerase-like protein (cupin superfamily)